MTWNYRIFKHVSEKETTYALHEVHYSESGQLEGWTENTVLGHFESVDELVKVLRLMLHDVERSCNNVLDYK